MGEIAEDMVNGFICAQCMQPLPTQTFTQSYCHDCEKDYAGYKKQVSKQKKDSEKVSCHICGKKVSGAGMSQHFRDKHR